MKQATAANNTIVRENKRTHVCDTQRKPEENPPYFRFRRSVRRLPRSDFSSTCYFMRVFRDISKGKFRFSCGCRKSRLYIKKSYLVKRFHVPIIHGIQNTRMIGRQNRPLMALWYNIILSKCWYSSNGSIDAVVSVYGSVHARIRLAERGFGVIFVDTILSRHP